VSAAGEPTGSGTRLEVTVNGVARHLAGAPTLADLLADLGCDPRLVAVERNGAIVGRGDYAGTRLAAGDRLEIVRFVQGG
jgi:sulfur carrier protein